jgi:hypothetical protein
VASIERGHSRPLGGAALMAALLCSVASPAWGAAIQIGTRIDATATTFALPIEIVDGEGVVAWTFDLAYDASTCRYTSAATRSPTPTARRSPVR